MHISSTILVHSLDDIFRSARFQFSRLLAAEVCASAVVKVVMLDTPCSEVECDTTGYPLHSHVSPSLPLLCVTVCHQVSTELYSLNPFVQANPSQQQMNANASNEAK
jgi:hypothetical protein